MGQITTTAIHAAATAGLQQHARQSMTDIAPVITAATMLIHIGTGARLMVTAQPAAH